jgi:hypothetical protein
MSFCLPGYVIIILSTLIFVLVCKKYYSFLLLNKVSYCNCFRIFVPPMYCNVCVTGETLLGKVRNSDTELVKWSGAPAGLSKVRWTRTTVGGPNDLGGSITVYPIVTRLMFAMRWWTTWEFRSSSFVCPLCQRTSLQTASLTIAWRFVHFGFVFGTFWAIFLVILTFIVCSFFYLAGSNPK